MRKFFLLLTCLLFMQTLHATSKRRPVRLGHYDCNLGKPKPNRSPAKELVALYQENDILYVNLQAGLLVTIIIKDADGSVLSQEVVATPDAHVTIPMGGAIVEVSFNEVNLVGLLY